MTPRVYLAGAITGLSYKDAVDWRKDAERKLSEVGITAYSPMRAKEFLAGTKKLSAVMDAYDDPMTTTRGIVCRDYQDCVRADAIIVNFLGTNKISAGTCFEMAWAFDRKIPLIVVAEEGNIHLQHPFILETAHFVVPSVSEALRIAQHVLLPGGNYERS